MADMDSNAPKLVSTLLVMATLSLFFMLLRLFVKWRCSKLITHDDYLLIFSWLCLATYSGLTVASTAYGIGRHIDTVEPSSLVVAVKFLMIGEVFAILGVSISKTSFAVTLLRLAQKTWHKVLLWGAIVSVNLVMWLCAVIVLAQCSPTEKLWDPTVEGTCWDPHVIVNYSIFAGSWSALMDFILAAFPWVLIWRLQMRPVEKFAVGVAMSLGILSGITAAIKTSYLEQSGRWLDFTFLSTGLLVWAAAESAVIIIASSIPFFRPLLKEMSRKGSGKNQDSSYQLGHTTGHYSTVHRTKRLVVVEAMPKQDDQSDKSIFGDTTSAAGGVMRTDDIVIEYGDADLESQKGSIVNLAMK